MKAEIGNRIKEFRTKKNLSQAEFGEKIGLSFQHVSRYERGEVLPSGEILAKICETYNINLNWLLAGEGPMERGYPSPEKEGVKIVWEDPELNEIVEWLKDHPRDKKLILKYIKIKKDVGEAVQGLEMKIILKEEE